MSILLSFLSMLCLHSFASAWQMSLWDDDDEHFNPYEIDNTFNWIPHDVGTSEETQSGYSAYSTLTPPQKPMTSASSMNHEIIRKSIKYQSQRGADNGDILDHRHSPEDTTQPFIPKPLIAASHTHRTITTISTRSLWFYAVSSVVLTLCCLTTPTVASVNITHPLPLWVFLFSFEAFIVSS